MLRSRSTLNPLGLFTKFSEQSEGGQMASIVLLLNSYSPNHGKCGVIIMHLH